MPRSAHFAFTDPYPFQRTMRTAEVDLCVTARGEFRAELAQVDLHRLWMQFGREMLPRVYHAAVSSKRSVFLFLSHANQAGTHHSGMEVRPGDIVVDSLGATHHHRTEGACQWGSMSLTPDDLAAASYVLAGHELTPPSVTYLARPNPAAMGRLTELHNAAGQLADKAPDILKGAEVARALEDALVRALIACLTEAGPVSANAGSRNHVTVMNRFEEALAANPDRPLYVAEICAATGVSERTLRGCCQEHLGMSPMRYLWLRRMHLARRALFIADPATATVTSVATDHGFWELGRFSVAYRQLFGESPSATLRGRRDDPRRLGRPPLALPESA